MSRQLICPFTLLNIKKSSQMCSKLFHYRLYLYLSNFNIFYHSSITSSPQNPQQIRVFLSLIWTQWSQWYLHYSRVLHKHSQPSHRQDGFIRGFWYDQRAQSEYSLLRDNSGVYRVFDWFLVPFWYLLPDTARLSARWWSCVRSMVNGYEKLSWSHHYLVAREWIRSQEDDCDILRSSWFIFSAGVETHRMIPLQYFHQQSDRTGRYHR